MLQKRINILKLFFIVTLLNGFIIEVSISHPATNEYDIVEFSDNLVLSTDDFVYSHHVEPTLAISQEDHIFVGWKNAHGHNTAGVRVSFTRSVDNGKTWTEPYDMPMYKGIYTGQSDPWLVWDDTGLYYAYLEYSIENEELSQITVAKSLDDGTTWGSPVNATGGNGFADKETMTVSNNGIVYIAYDDITNYTTVRLSSSSNQGYSFSEVGVIADAINQPLDHLAPYVITNSNNDIYIAWIWFPNNKTWGDVYLTASEDQGESFSTPIDINPTSENCSFEVSVDQRPSRVTLPVIKFDQNDRLYALWSEKFELNGSWDVYVRYSDDYGSSWSARYQVNPETPGHQWQPDMDIDSQNRLHIVWYDQRLGSFIPRYRIMDFSNASEGGIFWGETITIADESTPSTFTRPGDYFTVRVDSDDIPHVVWTDGRSGNELDIYYAHGMLLKSSTNIDFSGVWIITPLVLVLLGIRNKLRKKEVL
ncbi:MAG: sialidase family protein [Candidatus Hodarchaeales archaeon]|jgi:hypothetical protein